MGRIIQAKNDFNFVSTPNHLVKGVVAGIIIFALTNSLPAYAATIAVVHLASCAFSVFRKNKQEKSPSA